MRDKTTKNITTNILLTCFSDAEVGGVQVLFRDLVRWLEKSGRTVHLMYPTRLRNVRLIEKHTPWGHKAFYCPMPVIVRQQALFSVPIFLAYLPLTLFYLARVIREQRIQVINCHYLTPYFLHFVVAARLLRVRLIVSVHGSDVASYVGANWLYRIVFRQIMRGADHIVACSGALARQTAAVFPEARGKISWVHNALDETRINTAGELKGVRSPFVLCVCRHVHLKGVDTLLTAFASICDQAPDVSLVLVGDGPLRLEHRELAKRLGIEERVVFVGEVAHSEVAAFYSKCTLFVLPSRAEAFGLVVLEAGFHRKPIVCTRVGGLPEIVANGVNGFLVEADCPSEMGKQMLAILHDEGLARRLGDAAYDTVIARFLWRNHIRDYIDVYEGRPRTGLDAQGAECEGFEYVVTQPPLGSSSQTEQ